MDKRFFFLTFIFLSLGLVILPSNVLGRIGVAIGTGKIYVEETLKPGIINVLPSITVINNGDQAAEYEMSIQYHYGQETDPEFGLMPPREWFVFKPKNFTLEPGQRQVVDISLVLPVNAKPGRYFAYLDAKPIIKSEGREATIGISAAAKLWFNVQPANLFFGIYYRLLSIYAMYSFWINLAVAVIGAIIFVTLFRRFFSLNISIKKSSSNKAPDASNEVASEDTEKFFHSRPKRTRKRK